MRTASWPWPPPRRSPSPARASPSLAPSPSNVTEVASTLKVGLISANKLNQLMHVRFLPTLDAVREHMERHAEFLRPRFACVQSKLEEGLGGTGCATWTHPNGGYFVSFDGPEGSAKRVGALCKEMGVTMTPRRRHVALRRGPARHEHPHRAELSER